MATNSQSNPYLDASGRPIRGQEMNARLFAQRENQRDLDSLPPAERARALARQRNAHNHQNS